VLLGGRALLQGGLVPFFDERLRGKTGRHLCTVPVPLIQILADEPTVSTQVRANVHSGGGKIAVSGI
jgi:hypothetical protein